MARTRYVDLSGGTPPPAPPPPPADVVIPPAPPRGRRLSLALPSFRVNGLVVLVALLVAVNLWQFLRGHGGTPSPGPRPPGPGIALGKGFRGPLCDSLAEGYDLMATQVAAGVTIAEADKALKDKFHASRAKAFDTQCADAFVAVVPEEGEPKTQAQRDAWVALCQDFAAGLRYRGK